MQARCSLYVDVGYLLASAATRVTGTSLRNGVHVEFGALIASLIQDAEQRSGLPLLRVHWYDSAHNGVPDVQQERIGEISKVKLRLGRFGVDGQQKGVDLRIGLDLVAHARNDTADVFFLVSGDDDLTEAVEEAQGHGVQVVVLAVPNADGKAHGVSRHLIRAADEIGVLPTESIDSAVMRVELPAEPPPVAASPPVHARPPVRVRSGSGSAVPTPRDIASLTRPMPVPAASALVYQGSTGGPSQVMPGYGGPDENDEQIDAVVVKVLSAFRQSATQSEVNALRQAKPSIPRDIDRALLVDVSDALGIYDLPEQVRFRLRERFWTKFDELEL